MQLILSCACCGSTDFNKKALNIINIENTSYLLHENYKDTKLVCSECGLEDYVENLVITFR